MRRTWSSTTGSSALKKWLRWLVRPTFTSRRTATRHRPYPEHSRMPWAPGRRSSRLRIGTPPNFLDDGRGVLVPFEDSNAIATAAIELLDNDAARQAMRKRAYLYARHMVWDRVAQSYMRAFVRARANRMQPAARGVPPPSCREERYKPALKCLSAFPVRIGSVFGERCRP